MRRRLLALVAMLGTAAALVTANGVAHAKTALVIHKVAEAHLDGGATTPVFVLLIGSDARPGLSGARSDALHVVGINAALHQATMIDIPRDTYVAIPGLGHDKINAAFATGGWQLEADVVSKLVGVPISYVVTTTFDGFTAMVDELGGVDVDVPFPMHDKFSGADFATGRVHMSGDQALAFSRDRHLADGDLRRAFNQGQLILHSLAKLRSQNPGAIATLKLLAVLGRHTETHGLGVRDLYRLGRLGLAIDPSNIHNVVVPSRLGKVGAADVVFTAPEADSLFADFRDDGVLQTH